MQDMRPIGLIGLGRLGTALVRRLSEKNLPVQVYDLDGERRRAFLSQVPGVEIAPSLTDFGMSSEIIVSALPDIPRLRTAAIGDSDRPGFALAMAPGSIIVHFGGGPYKDALRMTGQLGSGGIGLIDVLSCAAVHTESDEPLEMLVGGFPDLVERARPVFDAVGAFKRVGATGTAIGLSALRSYVRAARLIALSEAILIGRHAGIAPDTLARVFDGPVATGPECSTLAGGVAGAVPQHDLASTHSAVADAVGFSEHIGVSGECVAFARDMLSDALQGTDGADESALLRHFTAMTAET
ncbi:MAG: NAD(P)-binding domain-containing protein [Hyphomicrobiaceae bacterium]